MCVASAFLLTCVVGSTDLAYPQQAQNRGQNAGELELLPVQGNIHMLAGAGGNITVQAGKDGVFLVDSGTAAMSDRVLKAIGALSKGQVTYIVNTTDRSDHVGGNETFARTGRPLAINRAAQASVFIVAFSTILDRMSDRNAKPPIPDRAWPNDTYSVPQKNLHFNGEAIQIFHQPATTDGDSIVQFRRSDVISTGDVFTTTGYPVIRPDDGGGIDGVIMALNRIIELTVPAEKQEGGTLVIPGHGRLCDEADVVEYRDMVTIIRDRIKSMIEMGLTLRQVQAAKPTADYDGRYGATTGFWTTEQFVAAAYESLQND